jgi:hypothetical protein
MPLNSTGEGIVAERIEARVQYEHLIFLVRAVHIERGNSMVLGTMGLEIFL